MQQPQTQIETNKSDPMVELDIGGDSVDVELKDKENTSKVEDKKSEEIEVKETTETKEEVKDEREEYSDGVKKRIDRLTYKIREAERREQAAVQFAQKIKEEKDSLEGKFKELDDGYVNEFTGRVQSQLESAKNNLKNAVAKGDIDAQVNANQLLAKLAIEEERIKATEVQRKATADQADNAGQVVQQPVQNNVATPKPDPRAEAWA